MAMQKRLRLEVRYGRVGVHFGQVDGIGGQQKQCHYESV